MEPRTRRILLIHDLLEERGGAETFFLSEVAWLREQGYDVHVFGFADREGPADPGTHRYLEPRSRFLRKLLKFTFHPGVYWTLRHQVRRVRPHLVHLHMNTKYPLAVLLALRGCRVIQTVHSNGMFCPSGWLVRADDLEVCEGGAGWKCVRHGCVPLHRLPAHLALERAWHALARRRIAAFVPPSRHLARYLERFGFGPVHRIPYFSPVETTEETPLPEGPPTVLYVGVVTRQKGVRTLIEAAPAILARHPDARLMVVGDGAELEPLRARVRELGLEDSVQLVGRVPNQELTGYYRAAHVCVIPSVWLENSPLVAYEAMLAGRPIVGSDRGGIPDLIESGQCGFVVPARDPAALAERVGQLLEDRALAQRLGAQGRRYAKEALSKQVFFDSLESIACGTRRLREGDR